VTAPPPVIPDDPTKVPGGPTTPVGSRSSFVHAVRSPTGEITGTSLTPLHNLRGSITPSDLHFERHHAGVPAIDPDKHTLVIHGLVDKPIEFSLADLERFPSLTRVHFVNALATDAPRIARPSPT
jgi:sulfane dehydrogenase subunit SoxC